MAEEKKSFILYSDINLLLENLPREIKGDLFQMIVDYVNDLNPQTEDILLKTAFAPIKAQLKRDRSKWDGVKADRSESGRLGGLKSGEARRSKTKQNEATLQISKQNEANEAVNVSVNVNDSVNVNVNENKNEVLGKHPLAFFLNSNCPAVRKLKTQPTIENFELLEKKFSRPAVENIFLQMENKKDLTLKYTSVFLTAKKWLEMDLEKKQKSTLTVPAHGTKYDAL